MGAAGAGRLGAVHPDSLGHLLARTAMAHRRRAAELLAPVGLHPGQEMLLARVAADEDPTLGSVARALDVEPATVTKMVRRLEAAGLVARHPDPVDRRAARVVLTEAGRRAHEAALAVWAQLDDDTLAPLDEAERAQLGDLLGRIREALDRCGGSPAHRC